MSKHKANEKWSERFDEPVDEFVKEYTASIHFDKRLAKVDIMGSLAHAKMLAQQGIIDNQQWQEIEKGLHELLQQVTDETFPYWMPHFVYVPEIFFSHFAQIFMYVTVRNSHKSSE